MAETTPTQDEAMTKTKDVTVSMPSGGLPTYAKLSHALAVIVSGVIAVAVATVLADGTSVIKLKDPFHLSAVTNPELKSQGLNHRADELLGATYGIGLHHDQAGFTWWDMSAGSSLKELEADLGIPVIIAALPSVISTDDLKHPVPFLGCHNLKMAGLCAMWFGFIAEVVAVVMVIFHVLALADLLPHGLAKALAALIWLTLSSGFMIVVLLAVGIYTATWECDNSFIPSIVIADHFEYNYGFYFAIVGLLSSLLILMVVLTGTASSYPANAPAPSLVKAGLSSVCGITVGLATCAVLSIIILGANGAYDPKPEADPEVNPCEGQKPKHAGPGDHYFSNVDCMKDNLVVVLEQAGANVTKGYKGQLDAGNRVPITGEYSDAGLCPVNVHWHLGAEHLSVGQFDEHGTGPYHAAPAHDDHSSDYHSSSSSAKHPPPSPPWEVPSTYVDGFVGGSHPNGRRLGADGNVRLGLQCHHYTASDPKFTTAYDWEHCVGMEVGQTYEIHWPHSAAGACGTPWAMQTPFYDGVFCHDGVITIAPLNTYEKIGVQSQVFTIVNDETYYNGNLINGAIVNAAENKWQDVAKYTGSTTGTSRNNQVCSRYTPITWQVDRKCHMISASSFDKLCQDMKAMKDDMSGDLYAHGARAVTAHHLTANNQQSRK